MPTASAPPSLVSTIWKPTGPDPRRIDAGRPESATETEGPAVAVVVVVVDVGGGTRLTSAWAVVVAWVLVDTEDA